MRLLPATPDAAGLPDAPIFPSGVAARLPRRCACGGWDGPPTAGCRFSAMMRPPAAEVPEPERDGGGGTTCGAAVAAAEMPPGMTRCSPTGSWGAGAMMELCPILRSPSWRVEVSTPGGGAITAGWGRVYTGGCVAAPTVPR